MPRHLANIDGEEVRRLASFGCTYKEIGAWFGVDESTVRKRFSLEKEQGEENGKTSLRRRQWKRAMEGSDVMLIHLGKHRLGQTDRIQIEQELPQVKQINMPVKKDESSDTGSGSATGSAMGGISQ